MTRDEELAFYNRNTASRLAREQVEDEPEAVPRFARIEPPGGRYFDRAGVGIIPRPNIPTAEAIRLADFAADDARWAEVMALASKYGYIVSAYGGTATLACYAEQGKAGIYTELQIVAGRIR